MFRFLRLVDPEREIHLNVRQLRAYNRKMFTVVNQE